MIKASMTDTIRKLIFSSLLVTSVVASASAETVLLSRGDDTFGQGWLFLDASGRCLVATPRHVLETADGSLSAPDLLDRFNGLHPTHSPVASINSELDLAFVSVSGQLAKSGCSRDRISTTALQPIIDNIKQADLQIATPTERQSIPVSLAALSRDSKGGGIIALKSVDSTISFQKGMSGGTIIYNGRPIAMLFEVDTDEGIGIAMRYDLIAEELWNLYSSHTPNDSSELRSADTIIMTHGRIMQKDAGLSSFVNAQSSLDISPAPDRIVFIMSFDKETIASGIQIQGDRLTDQGHLIIETEKARGGFTPGVKCVLANNLTCSMAPRRVTRLRVTLTGPKEAVFKLNQLSVIKSGA